jgi:16S rRNA (cytosine967-C5)-methyltransferase
MVTETPAARVKILVRRRSLHFVMPVSPARHAAFSILRQVESGKEFANTLLQGREFSALSEADRALGTELVMGVLRRQEELDQAIKKLSGRHAVSLDREVAIALRLGLYQMLFLDRIPHSAAVNESVELVKLARKRSAAGFVNAVLRKCSGAQRGPAVANPNLPGWLLERWAKNFGEEQALELAAASTLRPPTCLRVSGWGTSIEAVEKELAEDDVAAHRGRFALHSLLVESGRVKKSRAWLEGRVVIQDEGSQLVAELLNVKPGMSVLDVCAAPGMKMIQIAESLVQGTILALDSSRARLKTLEQLAKGHIPAGVRLETQWADAACGQLPKGPFDAVLADVPCTGTGTLARNPEIKHRLNPGDLKRLHGIQVRILQNALAVLAPGGRLVYSTCSLEPEENEEVVAEALGTVVGFHLLSTAELRSEFPHLADFFKDPGYFRTLSRRADWDRMDGFFAASIVRRV